MKQPPEHAAESPLDELEDRLQAALAGRVARAGKTGAGSPWPLLDSGALALDDDTWRYMSKLNPSQVAPYRELRHALSKIKLNALAVGTDGRKRPLVASLPAAAIRRRPLTEARDE
jgi:hypothetical protein